MSDPSVAAAAGPDRAAGRRRVVTFVLVVVVAAAVVVARPDPLAWAARTIEGRDPTVTALSGPARLGDPVNVLVVGSDAREDLRGIEGRFGELTGARADVVVVVRIGRGSVQALSVPRDLRVRTPERGVEPLATVLDTGGRASLVRVVRETLGVPIHHYVEVGFAGVVDIVDAAGGIEWSAPERIRDTRSGLEMDAGDQVLDGATVLAYLRSRSMEVRRDGAWHPLPDDDLARTQRHQELVADVLDQVQQQPDAIVERLDVVRDHVEVDPSLTAWTLLRLGRDLRPLERQDVSWLVLPVTGPDASSLVSPFPPTHVGARYWVELDELAAPPVLAELGGLAQTVEEDADDQQ